MAEWSLIRRLAAEAYGLLEFGKRSDGTKYVYRKDGSPEWLKDLCRAAVSTPIRFDLNGDRRESPGAEGYVSTPIRFDLN